MAPEWKMRGKVSGVKKTKRPVEDSLRFAALYLYLAINAKSLLSRSTFIPETGGKTIYLQISHLCALGLNVLFSNMN